MHAERAWIEAVPNKRFYPVCHICAGKGTRVYSREERSVRDLNFASARVWIQCRYPKIVCPQCQRTPIEDLHLFDSYLRVAKRLARYTHEFCKV